MTKSPYLRTMLVNGENHRMIKAIHTQDLVDYIALIQGQQEDKNVVYDFSAVIEYFHNRLSGSLRSVPQDLNIQRNAIFQKWLRYRTASSKMMKSQMGVSFLSSAQETQATIFSAIQSSKSAYITAREQPQNPWEPSKKKIAFELFSSHVESMIEVLLCNIHVTAGEDIKSFQEDILLNSEVSSTASIVIDCLQFELDYYQGGFPWRSIVNHCVMEDKGIDIAALFALMDIEISTETIQKNILSEEKIISDGDLRIRTCSWHAADGGKLDRAIVLAELLQKLRALQSLLFELKDLNYVFDGSIESTSRLDELVVNLTAREPS
ncbi:hypothetical protein [Pseudomonas fluorescens]|uniref:hypothetical protein n=1 Tax=Pseudomonas fluorescens TaxID=294 RepID=UPI001398DAEA|nr:hypothetical protein [Pseudomonas fluorescens]QIA03544.1 hypothetical protein GZH78_15820 [Pseudomonas fluorescens]